MFDGDLDFRNQYEFLAATQPLPTARVFRNFLAENPANPLNFFNIGAGLAALPFLCLLYVADQAYSAIFGGRPVSQWASIYPLIYLLGNITYGCGALYLTGRLLNRWFPIWECGFAVGACVLCGPALYYFFADIAMSHLPSAFYVALTLLLWLNWRETISARVMIFAAFAAGLSWGFSLTIRPYNLPLAILFAERAIHALRRRDSRNLIPVLVSGAGAFLGFLPQLLAWKVQHGTWLSNKVGYEMHPYPPYALDVLFSRTHGLFFWHPILLLGIVGLVAATACSYKKNGSQADQPAREKTTGEKPRGPAVVLLLVFAGVVWMYGNWRVWWLGVSFGMRGFVDFFAIFAFGLAAAASLLARRIPRKSARVICRTLILLFFLLNVHLYLCFRNGLVTVDGPLYWKQTVSSGEKYVVAVLREWWTRTDFDIGVRAHLLVAPPGRIENKYE